MNLPWTHLFKAGRGWTVPEHGTLRSHSSNRAQFEYSNILIIWIFDDIIWVGSDFFLLLSFQFDSWPTRKELKCYIFQWEIMGYFVF